MSDDNLVKCLWDQECDNPATQWVSANNYSQWYSGCDDHVNSWTPGGKQTLPITKEPPGDYMWYCHHPDCKPIHAGPRREITNDLTHATEHGYTFGFVPPSEEEVSEATFALIRLAESFK